MESGKSDHRLNYLKTKQFRLLFVQIKKTRSLAEKKERKAKTFEATP
jgi:hypothetical protein